MRDHKLKKIFNVFLSSAEGFPERVRNGQKQKNLYGKLFTQKKESALIGFRVQSGLAGNILR